MFSSGSSLRTLMAILALVAALGWVPPARADVITLHDGRVFEGTVYAEKDGAILFDTVVSGIKARLTFDKAGIKSIDKKAAPATPDSVELDPSLSGARTRSDAPALYLEIPITGRFKEQVFVQAIRSTMAYAKLHNVKHIVFTVDSSGGAVDEAGAIYRNVAEFENVITFHAVIANCTGEAVIVPFMCRTMHIQAGATVGGLGQKLENLPGRFAVKDEEVVRTQIAEDLAAAARQRGRKGEIIRALVDPAVTLAAWVDDAGEVQLDRIAPGNIPADRIIFADGPDQVLTLSYEQATRLGVPTIKGGVAALGPLLGLPGWREESSYGRDTMNKAIAARRRRANNAQSKFEDDVARNIRMRDMTSRAIESNLKQAATWNPTESSYQSLSGYFNPLWDSASQWDGSLWTPESRQKWKNRTDACVHFLSKAKSGIEAMSRLDREAVTLGLSPTFKPGDLDTMLDDVDVKLKMLAAARNRTGE